MFAVNTNVAHAGKSRVNHSTKPDRSTLLYGLGFRTIKVVKVTKTAKEAPIPNGNWIIDWG